MPSVKLWGPWLQGLISGLFSSCLQIEMLSPYEAVAERFKEQYKTFATALDTTRHELPVRSVHLDGDGQQFLGRRDHQCVLALVACPAPLSICVFLTSL